MDPRIFREYDIRGILGEQLDESVVRTLGRAIATFYARAGAKRIAVGYDARESSPGFCRILIECLNSAGCSVEKLGMVPTPVVYWATHTRNVDGAVMVTGSHNPPDHNGFKISLGRETLFGPQVQEIRKIAEEGDPVKGDGTVESLDVIDDYIADAAGRVSMGKRRLRIVVDAGNAVGGITAVPLYRKLGAEVIELFTGPDPTFPNHHPDPTVPENLQQLTAAVKENDADLGVAFDGDADRIGVVDETGRIIWGDQLTLLFARSILAERPGSTVIGEVKCSQVLFDEVERLGGKAVMERAGHSIIKARMRETGAALAGEMSGHIFFADRYYGFDDAAYAGARLLELLSGTEQPLSELLADIPQTSATPELRVACPDERKFEVVARVASHFATDHEVVTIDGARIRFEHGWGLVRASNTQELLVLRFEADSPADLDAIRDQVEACVRESLGSPADN